jgi:hypothetical protein
VSTARFSVNGTSTFRLLDTTSARSDATTRSLARMLGTHTKLRTRAKVSHGLGASALVCCDPSRSTSSRRAGMGVSAAVETADNARGRTPPRRCRKAGRGLLLPLATIKVEADVLSSASTGSRSMDERVGSSGLRACRRVQEASGDIREVVVRDVCRAPTRALAHSTAPARAPHHRAGQRTRFAFAFPRDSSCDSLAKVSEGLR